MEQAALETFLPDTGDMNTTLLWSGLLALAGLASCVFLLLKPSTGTTRNYRMLGAMLLFFVFLIASSTAFFSWLRQEQTGPLSIFEDKIKTAQGTIDFGDIRNARVQTAGVSTLVDPGRFSNEKRILLIEKKDGTAIALSEDNYPVDDILRSLRSAVHSWEGDN